MFITLKYHKTNFENNATATLINPAKNEIGRISKVIFKNIKNYKITYSYNSGIIQQVINWLMKIENKNKKIMIFNIKDFYSSISKKLLDDVINFSQQHIQIKRENFSIIQHARKSLLHNKEVLLQKKHQPFGRSNGILQWGWDFELVGMILLNNLANKFDKTSVGLYRHNGLGITRKRKHKQQNVII